MKTYRVDFDYIDFDISISDFKKIDLTPIDKNLTDEFKRRLNEDGFVDSSENGIVINMDFVINPNISLAHEEAIELQRLLRNQIREENLKSILE